VCRNFPQATISDMIDDASQGISFICNNIAEYGGDPNRYIIILSLQGALFSLSLKVMDSLDHR